MYKYMLCSILQRYDTRAIHNIRINFDFYKVAVLNTSKIRYKSNSQPDGVTYAEIGSCAQYFKDTIQEQFTTLANSVRSMLMLCSILQRYDTRAIHNQYQTSKKWGVAVLNTSKIRYKSNSQQGGYFCGFPSSCAQYFKDTIQEQFTTVLGVAGTN